MYHKKSISKYQIFLLPFLAKELRVKMTTEDQNEIKNPTGDWRAVWNLMSV